MLQIFDAIQKVYISGSQRGAWQNFGWRFKILQTNFSGKIENKNELDQKETDFVDILTWFTYFKVYQMGLLAPKGATRHPLGGPRAKVFADVLVFTCLLTQN